MGLVGTDPTDAQADFDTDSLTYPAARRQRRRRVLCPTNSLYSNRLRKRREARMRMVTLKKAIAATSVVRNSSPIPFRLRRGSGCQSTPRRTARVRFSIDWLSLQQGLTTCVGQVVATQSGYHILEARAGEDV